MVFLSLEMNLYSIGTSMEMDNWHSLENLLDKRHQMCNHCHQKLKQKHSTLETKTIDSSFISSCYNVIEIDELMVDIEGDTKSQTKENLFIEYRPLIDGIDSEEKTIDCRTERFRWLLPELSEFSSIRQSSMNKENLFFFSICSKKNRRGKVQSNKYICSMIDRFLFCWINVKKKKKKSVFFREMESLKRENSLIHLFISRNVFFFS